MSTARQFLNLVEAYQRFKAMDIDPKEELKKLKDDDLRTAIISCALTLQTLRDEAIRRGKWEEWKTAKVEK